LVHCFLVLVSYKKTLGFVAFGIVSKYINSNELNNVDFVY